jgi:hypothetical protein
MFPPMTKLPSIKNTKTSKKNIKLKKKKNPKGGKLKIKKTNRLYKKKMKKKSNFFYNFF